MNAAECEERALLLFAQRQPAEALEWFQRALEEGADPERNLLERWYCWVLLGDFERAWEVSDLRIADRVRCEEVPLASRVLIRCERGLGDAIQFLRFARLLEARANEVIVRARRPGLPLLALLPGVHRVFPLEDNLPASIRCDVEFECNELPYLFRCDRETIPYSAGYLAAPAGARFASDVPRVGIVWAAGEWNASRSVPFEALRPIWSLDGVRVVSLQQGPAKEQLYMSEALQKVLDAEPGPPDILRTLETVAQMDLVVTVDTMIAHLAGALGRPVWLLLQENSDWRWMLDGSESPWYKSMRIFRLKKGNRDHTVTQLASRLREYVGALQVNT